jgi:uncharacterized protein (DUF736 family)
MAIIGTLTPTRDGGWVGLLFVGSKLKVKFAPNDNQDSAKSPAFRIFAGHAELGAAWAHRTGQLKPKEYLSADIDHPGLSAPVSIAVFFADDGKSARVVWNRKD